MPYIRMLTTHQNIVLHDRQPAGITVLVTQALKDPLRRVPLLRRTALVLLQDLIDDRHKSIQLGPLRGVAPPIPRRHRERQHLRHRARIDAKPARRLTPAEPLDLNRVADLPIQLHELHPQPSAFNTESVLLLEFYSGAAGPPGRFSEGFLLRRLHPATPDAYWRAADSCEMKPVGKPDAGNPQERAHERGRETGHRYRPRPRLYHS